MGMNLPVRITMRGAIDPCVLVSLRVPAERVGPLLPPGLRARTLDHGGVRWAFVNTVVCRVLRMRPLGVPAWLGVSYWHVAHRVNVVADTAAGALSGLYFLRSDVDSALIALPGDVLSDFRFHRAGLDATWDQRALSARVRAGTRDRLRVTVESVHDQSAPDQAGPNQIGPERPAGSVFGSHEQAAAFLKYQPVSLHPDGRGGFRLAEVIRDESLWRERPVRVTEWFAADLDELGADGAAIEWATRVEPIPYRWRLGRRVGGSQSQSPTLAAV